MIVRRRRARLVVDVGEHLEAELGILVQNLQPARLVVAAIGADEVGIAEQAFEIGAHLFAPRRAGFARERGFAIGDELVEVVGHGGPPWRRQAGYSRAMRRRTPAASPCGEVACRVQETRFMRPQPLSADQMPRSSRKRSIGADDLIDEMR